MKTSENGLSFDMNIKNF